MSTTAAVYSMPASKTRARVRQICAVMARPTAKRPQRKLLILARVPRLLDQALDTISAGFQLRSHR